MRGTKQSCNLKLNALMGIRTCSLETLGDKILHSGYCSLSMSFKQFLINLFIIISLLGDLDLC